MAALFVIDIQTELASNPDTEIPHAARIRDAAAKILEVARSLPSQPIYFVQHEDAPGGSLIRGSKMWELVFTPQIGAANETLVAKTTSAYSWPELRRKTDEAQETHSNPIRPSRMA